MALDPGDAEAGTGLAGEIAFYRKLAFPKVFDLHNDAPNINSYSEGIANYLNSSLPVGHNPVTLDTNVAALLSLTIQVLGLNTQVAHRVFVGPVTGVPAVPTFRVLEASDIPDLSGDYAIIVLLTGANKTVTASASSGGGTTTGHIHITIHEGDCTRLRVRANGNTTDSDIEFFSAAGEVLANRLYYAEEINCFANPYHVDQEPWAIPGFSTALTLDELHYRITNNGANASTYEIEMVLMGEV